MSDFTDELSLFPQDYFRTGCRLLLHCPRLVPLRYIYTILNVIMHVNCIMIFTAVSVEKVLSLPLSTQKTLPII